MNFIEKDITTDHLKIFCITFYLEVKVVQQLFIVLSTVPTVYQLILSSMNNNTSNQIFYFYLADDQMRVQYL